jgi:nicotinamidase/pyrazinamidase
MVMKKTLIVVDMQNDFIDGSLGTREAQAIVGKVKDKIKSYQENHGEIIFTRDTHTKDYLNTNEGKHLPVEHCIAGTEGWRIADGLEIADAVYIDKPTFGYMDWKHYNLEEVEIVGLCTDICVVSNALIIKATYPEINVTVDASCCAGVTPETHKAALDTMKMCQVNVIGE